LQLQPFTAGAVAYCYYSKQASGVFSSTHSTVPPGCSETDAQGAITQGIICFDGQNQANSYDYYPGQNWTCFATPSTPVDPNSYSNVPGVWCTVSGAWILTGTVGTTVSGTGAIVGLVQTVVSLPAGCARPDPNWKVGTNNMVCFAAISTLTGGSAATGVSGTIAASVGQQYGVRDNVPPVVLASPAPAGP
jgi:hypothetical protein